MKRFFLGFLLLIGLGWSGQAQAVCPLPYVLNNGTITDAAKVMADLNALAACSGGIGPCSATVPGSVPATGGGIDNFLRADCTFAAPPTVGACDSANSGLVPPTGGGTANFLRADCTFAAPPSATLTCATVGCPYDIAMFWPDIPPASQIVRVAIPRAVTCPANLSGTIGNSSASATATTTVNINAVVTGVSFLVGQVIWSAGQFVGTPGSASGFETGFSLGAGDDVEFQFQASPDATMANPAITLKCERTSLL